MKYLKANLSTYKSLLTGKRTQVILSYGKCGNEDYREARIFRENGKMVYVISDGYNFITPFRETRDNLKSAINLVYGKIVPTHWYAK